MSEKKNTARERAQGTVGFSVAGFPAKQWESWNESCIEEFGDCRWLKMWNDHCKAKDYVVIEQLNSEVRELRKRVEALESKKQENKEVVKTLTGVIED